MSNPNPHRQWSSAPDSSARPATGPTSASRCSCTRYKRNRVQVSTSISDADIDFPHSAFRNSVIPPFRVTIYALRRYALRFTRYDPTHTRRNHLPTTGTSSTSRISKNHASPTQIPPHTPTKSGSSTPALSNSFVRKHVPSSPPHARCHSQTAIRNGEGNIPPAPS